MGRDGADITVRPARAADAAFLETMLVAAVNWDPGQPPRTPDEVLAHRENRHYVDDWPREGDLGVVAEDADGAPVGAAWLRYFGASDPGYGFIDPSIPEVSVGVVADRRGEGIGTALLARLEASARERGITTLALSVEPSNPAARLYARRGYVRGAGAAGAGGAAGALTLRLDL